MKLKMSDVLHAGAVGLEILEAIAMVEAGGPGTVSVSVHGRAYTVTVARQESPARG